MAKREKSPVLEVCSQTGLHQSWGNPTVITLYHVEKKTYWSGYARTILKNNALFTQLSPKDRDLIKLIAEQEGKRRKKQTQ